jgi:hypothetical protein
MKKRIIILAALLFIAAFSVSNWHIAVEFLISSSPSAQSRSAV